MGTSLQTIRLPNHLFGHAGSGKDCVGWSSYAKNWSFVKEAEGIAGLWAFRGALQNADPFGSPVAVGWSVTMWNIGWFFTDIPGLMFQWWPLILSSRLISLGATRLRSALNRNCWGLLDLDTQPLLRLKGLHVHLHGLHPRQAPE